MRARLFVTILFAALSAAVVSAQPRPRLTPPSSASASAFLHVARAGGPHNNIHNNFTWLVSEYPHAVSSPLTDANEDAILFVTHNASSSTTIHSAPVGVYQEGTWRIFNQNTGLGMVAGQAFNVQVAGASDSVFVWQAGDVAASVTYVDHPLLNGNPSALLSVTQLWEFGFQVYNNKNIGVYYSNVEAKWSIFNEDQSPIPANAMFNVQVLLDSDVDFSHVAAGANIVNTSRTRLDHPLLNNNSRAQIIVTQNYSLGSTYNDHPIGVEYDAGTQRWRIRNMDGAAMPLGAGFNVHIASTNLEYTDGVLYNGSFEVPDDAKKYARMWSSSAGTKRVCDKFAPKSPETKIVSQTGVCAFQMTGAVGQIGKLNQTVAVYPTLTGNATHFSGWFKGKNAGGAKAKIVIKLNDLNKVKFKIPGSALNGTYDWMYAGDGLLLPPGTFATQLKVTLSIVSGKLILDDVVGEYYTDGGS